MGRLKEKDSFFDNSKIIQLHEGYFLWAGTSEFCLWILTALSFCN